MQIITPSALGSLNSPRFVDARSGPDAYQRYLAEHLPGAIHVDLDKDLADIKPDAAQGGRHPLPSPAHFANWLGRAGITPQTNVVVYDDKNGANAAARFWWMLRALGHQNVQVVSGGLQALKNAGWKLTSEATPSFPASSYPVTPWQLPLADMEEVALAATNPGQLVIDVREDFRYRGEKEPIDAVAGHIPGAVNLPYLQNMDSGGNFLSGEKLRENYTKLIGNIPPANLIVHCGSGVTACHTLLALEEAGLHGAKLYVGSWSEWSRNDRPVAKGTSGE